jgi:hypothetical protein
MRVDVRGTIYESVAECAVAVGRSQKTVYAAIANGATATLGLGTVRNHKHQQDCGRKPHCVAGVWFPSISALARYIGKDVSHTRVALNKGGRAYHNLEKRVREKHEQ